MMEFCFDTVYDQKALGVMAKALRKTLRKKRSRRSHIFGVILAVLCVLLAFANLPAFSFRNGVTLLVGIVLVVTLLFEDALNGYIARRRMLPGLSKSVCTFTEEHYTSSTEVGESVFPYENISALAEDKQYFVLIFSPNHAQIYDKRTLTGGSAEEFRSFIERRCGKTFANIG